MFINPQLVDSAAKVLNENAAIDLIGKKAQIRSPRYDRFMQIRGFKYDITTIYPDKEREVLNAMRWECLKKALENPGMWVDVEWL